MTAAIIKAAGGPAALGAALRRVYVVLGFLTLRAGAAVLATNAPVLPEAPASTRAIAALGATNEPLDRCLAADYFRRQPTNSTAVLHLLVGVLGDERRVMLRTEGWTTALPSSPAAEARKALEAAGPAATDVLIEALKSPVIGVRQRAAEALARIPSDRVIPPLVAALDDPARTVSLAASESLAARGTDVVAAVAAYLAGPAPDNADRALWVLGRIRVDGASSLILPFLSSTNDRTRAAAASALAAAGGLDERALVRSWDTADSTGRERLLAGLRQLATTSAVDRIMVAALAEPSELLRGAAVEALAASSRIEAGTVLMRALRDERTSVREKAGAALSRLGRDSVESLAGFLRDADDRVAADAAAALVRIPPALLTQVLLPRLREKGLGWTVRRRVAGVLMASETTTLSYDDLIGARLALQDWELMNIFMDEVPASLAAATTDPDPSYRMGALSVLGQLKPRNAEEYLVRGLEDSDDGVVNAAARGLAEYGYAQVDRLEDVLQHGSLRSSRAAARALRDIGYRPRALGRSVEYHAAFGAMDRIIELGTPATEYVVQQLRSAADPALCARFALILASIETAMPRSGSPAGGSPEVRKALVAPSSAERLDAIAHLDEEPGILLSLCMDPDKLVAEAAAAKLAAHRSAVALVRASVLSGDAKLQAAGLLVLDRTADGALGAHEELMTTADDVMAGRIASLFRARGHVPAAASVRAVQLARLEDWTGLAALGPSAVPAFRLALAGASSARAQIVGHALAAARVPDFDRLLVEESLARPEQAGQPLVAALTRRCDAVLPVVREALHAGPPRRSAAAAGLLRALGAAPTPGDADHLAYLVATGDTLALQTRRHEAEDAMLAELKRPEPDRQLCGAYGLSLLSGSRVPVVGVTSGDVAMAIEQLGSRSAVDRAQAALRLADAGSLAAAARPKLLGLLSDNSALGPRARQYDGVPVITPGIAAALALSAQGPAAAPDLLELWKRNTLTTESREALAIAISRVADPRLKDAHVEYMRSGGKVGIVLATLRSYGAYAPADAAVFLMDIALTAKDRMVAAEAEDVLRKIGRAATPELVRSLGTSDPFRQALALRLLGALHDATDLDAILRMTTSLQPEVRCEAAKALGLIGDSRAARVLVPLLDDTSTAVSWNASEALALLGAAAVEPAIKGMARFSPDGRYATGALLRRLTGQNFGADALRWEIWMRDRSMQKAAPDAGRQP